MAQERKLFVIYFIEGWIGTAPTVLGFARELSKLGHLVRIRAASTAFARAGSLPDRSQVNFLSRLDDHPVRRRFSILLRAIGLRRLVPWIEWAWILSQAFLADLRLSSEERALHRVNIGIDADGAILAWLIHMCCGNQYFCLSLELVPPPSNYGFRKFIRWLEDKALNRARGLAIQDAARLDTFARYHSQVPLRVFFLPNSTGPATVPTDKNYFRRKFGLDSQRFPTIVLQAGMIDDISYCRELAQAFSQIDVGYALIFHERIKRLETDPYIQSLRRDNSKNLFLSLDPVPFDQVDLIFSSATIGLAFYRPIDENHSRIGLASGKLLMCLKHGLPVLMNALPPFETLNRQHRFGIIIQNPENSDEMQEALNSIVSGYDFYSSNASRCFREIFDFELNFGPVANFLESL